MPTGQTAFVTKYSTATPEQVRQGLTDPALTGRWRTFTLERVGMDATTPAA